MAGTQTPGLEHTGKEGKDHRTGTSGAEQGSKKAAPETGGPRGPRTTDAPDCNIRGRARRPENGLQYWSILGKKAERPGLDHAGLNKKG